MWSPRCSLSKKRSEAQQYRLAIAPHILASGMIPGFPSEEGFEAIGRIRPAAHDSPDSDSEVPPLATFA